jgi:ATP-dependent Lon protease
VGGIKEKVLAAHRAGLKRVVLPERNRKDLAEIPAEVRAELDIRFCKSVEELLPLVFGKAQAPFLAPPPVAGVPATGVTQAAV